MNQTTLDPRLSPHCLQNHQASFVDGEFTVATRLLDHDTYPELLYKPTSGQTELTTVHYGRRQLLINEIEFLTNACIELEKDETVSLTKKSIVVIYAGAASGIHLLVLAEFFPFLKFVLVDPQRVDLRYGRSNYQSSMRFIRQNIEVVVNDLRNEYGDDKWIRLFMSDIRTNDTGEEQIKKDHQIQKRAHEILEPYMSFLKFRPPYYDKRKPDEKIFNYLDGKIYLLIWGRSKTSETRLVCFKDAQSRDYDFSKYENQVHHFSMNQRTSCYKHDVDASGIDHCYDCRAEVYVLEQFLSSSEKIKSLVNKLQCPVQPFVYPGTISQLVERINMDIDSSSVLIGNPASNSQFILKLGNQMLKGRYKFTRLRYGVRLATLADFNRYFERVDTVPLAPDEDELASGLANLNI